MNMKYKSEDGIWRKIRKVKLSDTIPGAVKFREWLPKGCDIETEFDFNRHMNLVRQGIMFSAIDIKE